jgi:hypothetical protein
VIGREPSIADFLSQIKEKMSTTSSQPMLEKNLLGPSARDIREQRRIRAKTYRELYLLPRYVVEEDGSKRKLEAGEYDPNSKLYPLCTPIKDLSDFGECCYTNV